MDILCAIAYSKNVFISEGRDMIVARSGNNKVRPKLVKDISRRQLDSMTCLPSIPENCPNCGTKFQADHIFVVRDKKRRVAECWRCHTKYYFKKPSDKNKNEKPKPQKNAKKKELSSVQPVWPPELLLLPKEPPEMGNDPETIAVIDLKFGKNYGYLTVTNDYRLQDTKERGLYWIQRELAYKALIAMLLGEKKFSYKDQSIKINYYYTHEGPLFQIIKDRFLRFSNTESPVDIYLCESSEIHRFDVLEELTALIFIPENNSHAPLTVYYNKLNDRYYSRIGDYKLFLKTHGLPINKLVLCSGIMNEGTLNAESKLKILGYSVNAQDDFSQMYRERILQEIIEGRLMTKREIMKHLDFLISIHDAEYRFDDAVRKWTHDLQFVSNYTPSHHRTVTGSIINPNVL